MANMDFFVKTCGFGSFIFPGSAHALVYCVVPAVFV